MRRIDWDRIMIYIERGLLHLKRRSKNVYLKPKMRSSPISSNISKNFSYSKGAENKILNQFERWTKALHNLNKYSKNVQKQLVNNIKIIWRGTKKRTTSRIAHSLIISTMIQSLQWPIETSKHSCAQLLIKKHMINVRKIQIRFEQQLVRGWLMMHSQSKCKRRSTRNKSRKLKNKVMRINYSQTHSSRDNKRKRIESVPS